MNDQRDGDISQPHKMCHKVYFKNFEIIFFPLTVRKVPISPHHLWRGGSQAQGEQEQSKPWALLKTAPPAETRVGVERPAPTFPQGISFPVTYRSPGAAGADDGPGGHVRCLCLQAQEGASGSMSVLFLQVFRKDEIVSK